MNRKLYNNYKDLKGINKTRNVFIRNIEKIVKRECKDIFKEAEYDVWFTDYGFEIRIYEKDLKLKGNDIRKLIVAFGEFETKLSTFKKAQHNRVIFVFNIIEEE